jgi:hypothetical protein
MVGGSPTGRKSLTLLRPFPRLFLFSIFSFSFAGRKIHEVSSEELPLAKGLSIPACPGSTAIQAGKL